MFVCFCSILILKVLKGVEVAVKADELKGVKELAPV